MPNFDFHQYEVFYFVLFSLIYVYNKIGDAIMKAKLDPEYYPALLKTVQENKDIYIKEADEVIDRFLGERKSK